MIATRIRVVNPDRARATIAKSILDENASDRLGSIVLKKHQSSAVSRLRDAIAEFGGAVLCDPVGTGKTYIALALCGTDTPVLVVAPAILRDMWMNAARVAGMRVTFASFESLSRGSLPPGSFAFLIVDEAHHARNPAAHRYSLLSRLASRSKVLLLTATPIHNRHRDLTSLLSLFLGQRSKSLTGAELGRCVLRREYTAETASDMPEADPPIWCALSEDSLIPQMLLDLPPPLPPRDGGDGGALIIHSLFRQWSSSGAALEAGLKRRLNRASALIAALEDGTWPSRSELKAWISAPDSLQLAFSLLLSPVTSEARDLMPVVCAHRDAVARVLKCVATNRNADIERAGLIRRIRTMHPERRIVAFSQYAETVEAMFRQIARDGGVGVLSGAGARVSGGRITRRDAIAAFAPRATGNRAPLKAESISLLLTTDLLSEGVNLQDAGVVIHFDLPWTPARMEQRLGRVARIGSEYSRVFSYAIRPPASANEIVQIERILDEKMEAAGIVTDQFQSLGRLTVTTGEVRNEPTLTECCRKLLARWRNDSIASVPEETIAAAVRSTSRGFLALCAGIDGARLIGSIDDRIGDDTSLLIECIRECCGAETSLDSAALDFCTHRLSSWLDSTLAMTGVLPATSHGANVRQNALKQIVRRSGKARAHDRARIASLAHRARSAVLSPFGAYDEERLDELCKVDIDDTEWLERAVTFGRRESDVTRSITPRIVAILMFGS